MELEGTWKSQYQMEGNGIERNMEISKVDGMKWNRKGLGNFNIRWTEMELEGTWESQYQMEGNGVGRNAEITKIDGMKWNWKEHEISILDGRNWNWKERGNLNSRRKEMEMEGTWKSQYQMEGNGIGWKDGNLKNRGKEMELEGTWKSL